MGKLYDGLRSICELDQFECGFSSAPALNLERKYRSEAKINPLPGGQTLNHRESRIKERRCEK